MAHWAAHAPKVALHLNYNAVAVWKLRRRIAAERVPVILWGLFAEQYLTLPDDFPQAFA
jgi:hypothetical protein